MSFNSPPPSSQRNSFPSSSQYPSSSQMPASQASTLIPNAGVTIPKCDGHQQITKLVTGTAEPNFGRKYYRCAQKRKTRCGYLEWEDRLPGYIDDPFDSTTVNASQSRKPSIGALNSSSTSMSPPALPSQRQPSQAAVFPSSSQRPKAEPPARPTPSSSSAFRQPSQAPAASSSRPKTKKQWVQENHSDDELVYGDLMAIASQPTQSRMSRAPSISLISAREGTSSKGKEREAPSTQPSGGSSRITGVNGLRPKRKVEQPPRPQELIEISDDSEPEPARGNQKTAPAAGPKTNLPSTSSSARRVRSPPPAVIDDDAGFGGFGNDEDAPAQEEDEIRTERDDTPTATMAPSTSQHQSPNRRLMARSLRGGRSGSFRRTESITSIGRDEQQDGNMTGGLAASGITVNASGEISSPRPMLRLRLNLDRSGEVDQINTSTNVAAASSAQVQRTTSGLSGPTQTPSGVSSPRIRLNIGKSQNNAQASSSSPAIPTSATQLTTPGRGWNSARQRVLAEKKAAAVRRASTPGEAGPEREEVQAMQIEEAPVVQSRKGKERDLGDGRGGMADTTEFPVSPPYTIDETRDARSSSERPVEQRNLAMAASTASIPSVDNASFAIPTAATRAVTSPEQPRRVEVKQESPAQSSYQAVQAMVDGIAVFSPGAEVREADNEDDGGGMEWTSGDLDEVEQTAFLAGQSISPERPDRADNSEGFQEPVVGDEAAAAGQASTRQASPAVSLGGDDVYATAEERASQPSPDTKPGALQAAVEVPAEERAVEHVPRPATWLEQSGQHPEAERSAKRPRSEEENAAESGSAGSKRRRLEEDAGSNSNRAAGERYAAQMTSDAASGSGSQSAAAVPSLAVQAARATRITPPDISLTRAYDWLYLSEGAANIVFAWRVDTPGHPLYRKVIRCRKVQSNNGVGAESALANVNRNEYWVDELLPRVVPTRFLPASERIEIQSHWLSRLDAATKKSRPAHRIAEGQGAIETRPDMMSTHLVENVNGGEGYIAVEIKPKCGVMPDPDALSTESREVKSRACRFCLHRCFRRGAADDAPGYCPLDLFSEDPARIGRAVNQLLRDWHTTGGAANNFRLFVDGQVKKPGNHIANGGVPGLAEIVKTALIRTGVLQALKTLQKGHRWTLDIETLMARSGGDVAWFPDIFKQEPSREELDAQLGFQPQILLGDTVDQNATRRAAVAYTISAIFRDCSLMIRWPRNAGQMSAADVAARAEVRLVDLDLKPLGKTQKWFDQDKEIWSAAKENGWKVICTAGGLPGRPQPQAPAVAVATGAHTGPGITYLAEPANLPQSASRTPEPLPIPRTLPPIPRIAGGSSQAVPGPSGSAATTRAVAQVQTGPFIAPPLESARSDVPTHAAPAAGNSNASGSQPSTQQTTSNATASGPSLDIEALVAFYEKKIRDQASQICDLQLENARLKATRPEPPS